MQFSDFPLDHRLLKTLTINNFESPTAIQKETIAPGISGKDLLACSKTGSGKTLAYLVPALHNVLRNKALSKKDPRVLVVCPTRELAKQVLQELKKLHPVSSKKPAILVGGENFNDQVKALNRDPDFVIGTPGRIADHIEGRSLFLNGLELLILDEADRVLDLGFSHQLAVINEAANHRKRQTLFFSATLDNNEILNTASQLLNAPIRVSLDDFTKLHQDISQKFIFADDVSHKEELLRRLLKDTSQGQQVIVYTATRDDTQRLVDLLEKDSLKAIALHGDMLQSQRNDVMQQFVNRQWQILITTDVASRGLDIPDVKWVINFDLPVKATEYIHRVGRTGRAGAKGSGYSFVGPKDWNSFVALKQLIQDEPEFTELTDLAATFKGFKEKKKPQKTKAADNKNKKTAKSPWPKKKKFDAVAGEDVGDLVFKKPRKK